MIGSLLVGALSSKRLSFSRLRDLSRPEAFWVPAAITASGAFSRDPLEIRRVAAGEQFNPDVGDATDTATTKQSPGSLSDQTDWKLNDVSSYGFYINVSFKVNIIIRDIIFPGEEWRLKILESVCASLMTLYQLQQLYINQNDWMVMKWEG